jgi:hypothetical protein
MFPKKKATTKKTREDEERQKEAKFITLFSKVDGVRASWFFSYTS